ncbi:MAG: discoidin domain-containing protein [Bryobacteraceae bacterium]
MSSNAAILLKRTDRYDVWLDLQNQSFVAAGAVNARCGCLLLAVLSLALAQSTTQTATVRVDTRPEHILNSFDPDEAIGSSIDVLSKEEIDRVYSPHILEESLSAGYGPVTYRNNSELRMAAWHWNANGTWSNPAQQSGYFTGRTGLGKPIRYILSYALPHRGFSTSGDRPLQGPHLSYWKSNPYLTSKFTGESDASHPQWVVVDLKADKPVNSVQIDWVSPYARVYRIEYWIGTDALDFDSGPKGEWKTFGGGDVKNGRGGRVTLKLAPEPVSTRYVRIWMTASSSRATSGIA